MIRRSLALGLLVIGCWLLTQGVAHASHCGEVNYDTGQAPTGDCGPTITKVMWLTGAGVAGAAGVMMVISGSTGKSTVTAAVAAAGPAPAGPGKSGRAKKGKTGKKTKAMRDAKSQARTTRRARRRAKAQEKRARRAKAERTRVRRAKAAGKNPPVRTETRAGPESRMDLEKEEGAVPTAGLGTGHSNTAGRFSQLVQGTSDLSGTFVQPQVSFAGAALGETSSNAPPWPAWPTPSPTTFASPADDPLAATLLGASMTLILVGQVGWDLTKLGVAPVVRWMGGWRS